MSSTNTFSIPKHKREVVLPNIWYGVLFFYTFLTLFTLCYHFYCQDIFTPRKIWIVVIFYTNLPIRLSSYSSIVFFLLFWNCKSISVSLTTCLPISQYDCYCSQGKWFFKQFGWHSLSLPLLFYHKHSSACLCCLLLTISSLLACTHTHILSTTSSPKVLPKLSVKREWEEMGYREDGALITPSLPLLLLLLPFEHFSVLYCYLWNSWMLCALLLSIKTAYLQMLCLLASVWLHSVRFGSVVLYLLCLLMLIFL